MAAKLGRSELGFVHLHVHSSYSLLEGALPIARLSMKSEASSTADELAPVKLYGAGGYPLAPR